MRWKEEDEREKGGRGGEGIFLYKTILRNVQWGIDRHFSAVITNKQKSIVQQTNELKNRTRSFSSILNDEFSIFWARANVDRAVGRLNRCACIYYIYAGEVNERNSIFYQFSIYRVYLGEIIDYIYIIPYIYIYTPKHLSLTSMFS